MQAFRLGERVYATQFHPELDFAGLSTRVSVYRNAGYFPPETADALLAEAARFEVSHPMLILRNFVSLFGS